jgi:hypothetical protein
MRFERRGSSAFPGRGGAFASTGLRTASVRGAVRFGFAAPAPEGDANAGGGSATTGAGGLCLFLCQSARLAREDMVPDAATAAGLPSLSVVRGIVHLVGCRE